MADKPTPLPEHKLPDYKNIKELEKGTQEELQHRTGRRKDTLTRKTLQLETMTDQSKATEKNVIAQAKDFADTKGEEIELLLNKALGVRDGADRRYHSLSEQQMQQIELLRTKLEANLDKLPPDQAELIREKMRSIMREAVEEKLRLEKAQKELSEEQRAELQKIWRMTEETRLSLKEKHEAEIRGVFHEIIDDATQQQQKMKKEFEVLINEEKTKVFEMLSKAKDKQRELKYEHQERQRDQKSYVKMQMKRCQIMIRKGKQKEAYEIQKQLIRDLKEKFQGMQSEQFAVQMDRQHEIVELKRESDQNAKQLQKRNKKLFHEIRHVMDDQEQAFYERAQADLLRRTHDNIENYERQMLEKHHDMYQEQQELIRSMQQSVQRQTRDSFMRRKEEYSGIVHQARSQVKELERRTEYAEKQLADEQNRLFRSAGSTLQVLDKDAEAMLSGMRKEHVDLLREEQQETMELLKEMEKYQKATEQENRQSILTDQLAIGRDAREKQDLREEEGRRESTDAMMDLIDVSKSILERIQKSKQEMRDLTMYEKTRMAELNSKLEHRLSELQQKHLRHVEQAKKDYQKAMVRISEREERLKKESQRLQEVTHEAQQNPAHMSPKQREAFERERDDLMELVSSAKAKHQALEEEISELKNQASTLVEERTEESRKEMKEKQAEVRAEYEREVGRLHVEKEERYQILKQEQKILIRQHESHKEEMQQTIDGKLRTLQAEKRQIFEESQQKLRDLEKKLLQNSMHDEEDDTSSYDDISGDSPSVTL